MNSPLRIALATFAIALPSAYGAARVNFGSTPNQASLQSDGTSINSDFAFQIGTFTGGFTPTADNTSEWLTHWTALSDAAADPLPEATTSYEITELPAPFPPGTTTEGFASSVVLDHNQAPFHPMASVYIWGYDNRTRAGNAEWLLATSSTWGWPSGTTNPPAVTFSISESDTVILGAINGDEFHMQTSAVTIENNATPAGYEAWLGSQFAAGALADPELADTLWGVLADPDHDGLSNVIEYFTGSDASDPASQRETAAGSDGDDLIFTFYQAKDTAGVVASVEWSVDLTHWQTEGVSIDKVEDLGDVYKVEARIPFAGDAEKFARLNVRRSLD